MTESSADGAFPGETSAARMPDLATTLTQIAEQLRTLSRNGLHFSDDPYQIERYQKILGLSAQLVSLVDTRPQPEIERVFFADLDISTPLAVVDTAVFDEDGRILLIQRADNHLWAMPGGACDVGEAPGTGGAREVWEETGYVVDVTHLIGVFDSRHCGQRTSRHLYHFLFAATVAGGEATTSIETLDVRWYAPDAIPWSSLSPGHETRIRHALTWYGDPGRAAYFDQEGWQPNSGNG